MKGEERGEAGIPSEVWLLESRSVFPGRLLDVRVDRLRLPDGSEVRREIVRHPGAAAVLPLRAGRRGDGGTDRSVILLRHYRYAAAGTLWEIPAGLVEPGEEPAACAARELEEEAGFRCGELRPLVTLRTTPGYSDERVFLFLARKLEETSARPEKGEWLERREVPLDRALEMVRTGAIEDAKTAVALLFADRFVDAGVG